MRKPFFQKAPKEASVLTLPEDLRKFFPDLSEGQLPTGSEVKEKAVGLNENGDQSSALALLNWQKERTQKKESSKLEKGLKISIFSLVVLLGGLGSFWLIYEATGSDSPDIVVCSINGQNRSGSDCMVDPTSTPAPNNENKDLTDEHIFVGS